MSKTIHINNYKSDKWVFPSTDDIEGDYTFYFDFIENKKIKEDVKRTTQESITIRRVKLSTLHRYNYQLKPFFDFLGVNNIILDSFADVNPIIIEQFVHYLNQNVTSPNTRAVCLASLKHHIKHGQILELDGYPTKDIFDGTEFRTLHTEDVLKSKIIPDDIIKQVDNVLKIMEQKKILKDELNNTMMRSLIMICRHTGLRVSEALNLHTKSLIKDFQGNDILEVISNKNETERYIPVNNNAVESINFLINDYYIAQQRELLGTTNLFLMNKASKKEYGYLTQGRARKWLEEIIKKSNITDYNGNLYYFTFHNFRHTIGTDMLNNGMSPFEVQEYLGHESMHSTRLYAKVRNDKLSEDYRNLGIIGAIVEKANDIKDEDGNEISESKRLEAALPDGICSKPLNEKVTNCSQPNACLFCEKFVTTPEYLVVHRKHLNKIKLDKNRYMEENLIGSEYLLYETEKTLEEIINQLEKLESERM